MRKSTFIKRFMALFLVVLMSINTFAAVVGDNDGAAFITKAEFDSMKNDFQSQLDRYNSSIDNKIDGAIASYLSGIRIASQKAKPVLMTNYDQLRWQPNFKLYGKYKKWTNKTTNIGTDNIGWYTPSLNEKRFNTRGVTFNIADYWSSDGKMAVGLNFSGNISSVRDGVAVGRSDYMGAGGYKQTTPTGCVKLERDGTDWQIPDTDHFFWNVFCLLYGIWANPHDPSVINGGASLWTASGRYFWINNLATDITFNALAGSNEIFSYDVLFKTPNANTYNFRSTLTKSNTMWPTIQTRNLMAYEAGYNATTSPFANKNDDETLDPANLTDYFNRGVTWNYITNEVAVNNSFKYLALGSDYDLALNAWADAGEAPYGYSVDMSNSTEAGSFTLNIQRVNIANIAKNYPSAVDYAYSTSPTVTVGVPYFPTASLRKLVNHNFDLTSGASWQVGQGLPLILDMDENGYIQISFDYDVKDLISESSQNKNIYFDIKKSDFNTSTTDFATGYLDFVNPDTTTSPIQTFQHLSYSQTSGNVKLTVPVTKGDSLWFRMTPQNVNGGYYAIMSNLKMTAIISG